MISPRFLAAACIALVGLFATSAQAQQRVNIVLLPIEVSPEYANQENLIGIALQKSLSRNFNVFFGDKVESALQAEYAKEDCSAETCVQNIAILFNGEIVVDASLQLVEKSTFLSVQFRNVITGELEAVVQDSCDDCSFTELVKFIDRRTNNIQLKSFEGLKAVPKPKREPEKEIIELTQPNSKDDDLGALESPNPLGEIVLGQADAPVTIVEYSSLTCPHCGAFHRETLPELTEKYIDKGLVKIYFRHFPFDPYATASAMLAHCVSPAAQVSFLDILYTRQQQWIQAEQPMSALQAIAQQVGLSESNFVACLKDQNRLDGIRNIQSRAAEELGVRSTPTFFINGDKLEGNQPLAAFEEILRPFLVGSVGGSF